MTDDRDRQAISAVISQLMKKEKRVKRLPKRSAAELFGNQSTRTQFNVQVLRARLQLVALIGAFKRLKLDTSCNDPTYEAAFQEMVRLHHTLKVLLNEHFGAVDSGEINLTNSGDEKT